MSIFKSPIIFIVFAVNFILISLTFMYVMGVFNPHIVTFFFLAKILGTDFHSCFFYKIIIITVRHETPGQIYICHRVIGCGLTFLVGTLQLSLPGMPFCLRTKRNICTPFCSNAHFTIM